MSGPRLVYPHFDKGEAETMADLASKAFPWVHEESEARAQEERAVPSDEIAPRDYIIMRRDRHDRVLAND